MDEKQRDKEYRRWHFLDFLGVVIWVMNRGIRGQALTQPTAPRLSGKPPLVELDEYVKLAALGQHTDVTLDPEQMSEVAALFQAVAAKDGVVSPEETALMRQSLAAHVASGNQELDVEQFLTAFKDAHVTDAQLKDTCHQLRTRLRPGVAERIVESLFRLARLHGLEPAEERLVVYIGEYLGLTSAEIRAAEFASRRDK